MKEELIKLETTKGTIRVPRLTLNLTSFGLYEGISNEHIIENLEFQGHPFGKTPLPILYRGLDTYLDLSNTYCVWMLLESEPIDPLRSMSSLAVCLVTDSFLGTKYDLIEQLSGVDYWAHCKDFDL